MYCRDPYEPEDEVYQDDGAPPPEWCDGPFETICYSGLEFICVSTIGFGDPCPDTHPINWSEESNPCIAEYCPDPDSSNYMSHRLCLQRNPGCACEPNCTLCKYCKGCITDGMCNNIGCGEASCWTPETCPYSNYPGVGVPCDGIKPCGWVGHCDVVIQEGNQNEPECCQPEDLSAFGAEIGCCGCDEKRNLCMECVDENAPCDCCGNPGGGAQHDGPIAPCQWHPEWDSTTNPYLADNFEFVNGCVDETYFWDFDNWTLISNFQCFTDDYTCHQHQHSVHVGTTNCPDGGTSGQSGLLDCCWQCHGGVLVPPNCGFGGIDLSPKCEGFYDLCPESEYACVPGQHWHDNCPDVSNCGN
jgi:hypothetical protein